MYTNKYIVIALNSDDLTYEEFDDYEAALKSVEASDDKALIVKAENICCDGWPPFKLEVEPHT